MRWLDGITDSMDMSLGEAGGLRRPGGQLPLFQEPRGYVPKGRGGAGWGAAQGTPLWHCPRTSAAGACQLEQTSH